MFFGSLEVTREEVAEEAKTCGRIYVIDARIKRTKRPIPAPRVNT